MTNIFKAVEDWPDYLIDIYGNVFSKRNKKLLASNFNSNGYVRAHLSINGNRKQIFKHIEIVKVFGDKNGRKYDPSLTIDHLDKDRTNCFIKNLELVSFEENLRRRDSKSDEPIFDKSINLDEIF